MRISTLLSATCIGETISKVKRLPRDFSFRMRIPRSMQMVDLNGKHLDIVQHTFASIRGKAGVGSLYAHLGHSRKDKVKALFTGTYRVRRLMSTYPVFNPE
jgi:hypothetical protein